MDCRTPGFPTLHCLWVCSNTRIHWVSDDTQPSFSSSVAPFSWLNPCGIHDLGWGINRVGFDSVNYNCVRCSVISNSLWPPLTVACQSPLSAEFSRQEYWNGLLLPTPGDLPDLGIEPNCPALQADSLSYELPGNPRIWL